MKTILLTAIILSITFSLWLVLFLPTNWNHLSSYSKEQPKYFNQLKEKLFATLADSQVRRLLLTIGLLGLLLEIITLHNTAGIIGVSSLFLFFLSYIGVNTALWGIVLPIFVLGLGLLIFELYFLPGHGLSAILGLSAVFYSIYFTLGKGVFALKEIFYSTLLAVILVALVLRYLPKSKVWKFFSGEGVSRPLGDLKSLEGLSGFSLTMISPSGSIEVNGRNFEAVAQQGEIPPRTKVRITRVEGDQLFVEKD